MPRPAVFSRLFATGYRRRVLTFFLLGWLSCTLRAAESIPPAPRDHFNDYAGVVSHTVARELNDRLATFERTDSNQVVVAVFPRMQSDAPVDAYTLRVAQAWGAGQKNRDNGVVLFAFMQERQLYLQVGTGLEARIPDSLARHIIEEQIVPRFRTGNIDQGLRAGVERIISALRATTPPAVQTDVEAVRPPATAPGFPASGFSGPASRNSGGGGTAGFVVLFFFVAGGVAVLRFFLGSTSDRYGPSGRNRGWPGLGSGPRPHGGGLFRSGGGGHFGGRPSGGGSFSGGGGSFRGGGAGGKW